MEQKKVAGKRSVRRRPPVTLAAPWLVFPHGKGGKDQAFYNICEPSNKTCRKSIPEMSHKSFWQSPSHQGWLVILCDDKTQVNSDSNWKFGDCFLWNPVSLDTIDLPNLLHWILLKDLFIENSVLTSPPYIDNITRDHDDNSMVFFHFGGYQGSDHVLVYCRPGDEQWRTLELPLNVRSLLCFKTKLYVMCLSHWLLEIERKFDNINDETLTVTPISVSLDPIHPLSTESDAIRTDYVASHDELFKVCRYYDGRCFDRLLSLIQILRLNFSLMAWEEVKSLGDHVLFIGQNTTASCSAAELGLTRGCVYFTLPQDTSLYKFDVEGQSISVSLPCLELPTPWFPSDWVMMMMPPTASVSNGRRKENILGNDREEHNIIEAEEKKTSTSYDDDEEEEEEIQGQSNDGGVIEEARTKWGMFNEDILGLIASYLHPVDYTHLRAVCRENRSAMPAISWRTSSIDVATKTSSLSPWLIFPKNDGTVYKFVDPMHNNEKYFMVDPELLLGATIRFSKGGWLLMSKGKKTIFFYNPFTRATIQLPDLPDDCPYSFSGISFSSSPTSSDCVVFCIQDNFFNRVFILFIARGDDIWRRNVYPNLKAFKPCLNNPVFYGGAFYCLDYNGTLGVFKTEDTFSWEVLAKPQGHFSSFYPSFLVECEGKLLSVDLGHVGKSIRIFRLDFSKKAWVKVESLGKHMLFISNTSCLSAIAPHSRMENKIYFPRLHAEGILFYSLDTGRYHSLGSRSSIEDFYETEGLLNCTWVEHNWSKTTTVEELDWKHLTLPT